MWATAQRMPARLNDLLAAVMVTVRAAASADSDGEGDVRRAGEDEIAPDLVADHEQVVLLGDLGDGREFVATEGAAHRVVRIAGEDHPSSGVDSCLEPFGVQTPALRVERHLDQATAARFDRMEERVVDGGEEHYAIARLGVQPQRDLDGLHDVAEEAHAGHVRLPRVLRLDALDIGPPAEATLLSLDEGAGDARGGREVVAEVAGVEQPLNRLDHDGRRWQVHVGDPRRDHVGTEAGPLHAGLRSEAVRLRSPTPRDRPPVLVCTRVYP